MILQLVQHSLKADIVCNRVILLNVSRFRLVIAEFVLYFRIPPPEPDAFGRERGGCILASENRLLMLLTLRFYSQKPPFAAALPSRVAGSSGGILEFVSASQAV